LVTQLFGCYRPGLFDDAYNIAVWQWELANFRADWFYSFDGLDEVWTNSQFQLESIRAVAPVPVTKIHIPVVAPSVRPAADRPSFGIPPDAFAFLVPFDVGSTSARKNPFAAVEAFRRVRGRHPGAHLVLKYHSARHEPGFTR